jgi:hypothetical protein
MAPPPDNLSTRSLEALGPPPPYRPIIQAGAAFVHGPAPDPRPRRTASSRRVRGIDPATGQPDPGWALGREPEPRMAPMSGPEDPDRRERDLRFGPKDQPVSWAGRLALAPRELGYAPPESFPGALAPDAKPRNRTRRLLWAAAILCALLAAVLMIAMFGSAEVARLVGQLRAAVRHSLPR